MEELLERIIKEMNLELSQDEKERILREFYYKTLPSVDRLGLVKTRDDTYTLVSKEFGEPYHSITAGALTEVMEKFVKPSGIEELAKTKKVLRIVDIGFGLGYNVSVALWSAKRVNPKIRVEILSFDKKLPEDIPILPEPYKEVHETIIKNIPYYEEEGISFKLFLGDARKEIQKGVGFNADVVLHDAFSPMRNPELWTYHFFERLRACMKVGSIWVSYTSSLPVRKALKLLGFGISSTRPVGRKKGGTKAILGGNEFLDEREKEKLNTSPYAVPFEDPDLSASRQEILIRYLVRVFAKQREVNHDKDLKDSPSRVG